MEEKNKNNGLIIALIVFIVISLILGGFIIYDKVLNKDNNNEVTENENSSTTNNDKTDNAQNSEINLTSEEAFKLIESKRKSLKYDTWSTLNAKVLYKGDNNYYWVTYTEANVDGYKSSLGVIFHYENGEWNFELPGFSAHGDLSQYNFVEVNNSEYFELNDDLAFALIEGKRRSLGYNTWTTGSAKVIKKGDNNYYWITYIEKNNDGYESSLGVIVHYENGEWNFELPGFSAHGDLSQYNFVDIN